MLCNHYLEKGHPKIIVLYVNILYIVWNVCVGMGECRTDLSVTKDGRPQIGKKEQGKGGQRAGVE